MCLITLSSSLTAYGQTTTYTTLPESPVDSVTDILNVLNFIVNVIFSVLIIVAVIIFLIAAFTYITAQGDTTKTGKASKMLMYAAIGLGVALLARGIEAIITGILKTTV